MRSVRRVRTLPPTLARGGKGGQTARGHREARLADTTATLIFDDHWKEPDVRGALRAIHGWACAYCGWALRRGDRGDVEHFRPKSNVIEDPDHGGYWWIAYNFNNYVLSCSPCNRYRKKDRFPLRPDTRRVTFETRARLAREARLLLHPVLDPIDEWLAVDLSGEIPWIRPQPGLSRTAHAQVEYTIQFFGWNRNLDLLKGRTETLGALRQAIVAGREEDAASLAVRYHPHSLVARQMLGELAPHLLPTPEDEFLWLVSELLVELDLARKVFHDQPQRFVEDPHVLELRWALAAIWRAPPFGTSEDVEAMLVEADTRDIVQEQFEQLPPPP